MSTVCDQEKKSHKKILLIAVTRLGDLLQASPTIIGLKKENPEAHITVLVDQGFAAICKGIPDIDDLYIIDLGMIVRSMHRENEGIVDAFRYLDEIVSELKAKGFDYCLNMASSGYTALLLKMLEIEESRGWISDEEGNRLISNPWTMLFAAYVYHSNRTYNSINLVDMMRCSAGVSSHPTRLVYNVPDGADQSLEELFEKKGLPVEDSGPLIALQVGASQEKRQWSTFRFASLCRILVEELNARVVLTGSGKEQYIINDVLRYYSDPRVVSVAGETNLDQLAALLRRADVMITGDTGPMHLSIAVGTPVVSLFLASAHCFETGPYGSGNIVIQSNIACQPCNPNFSCPRPDCHDSISPELVAHMAKLRLETPLGKEAELPFPDHISNPQSVALYYSSFDEDNFLEFIEIPSESKLSDPQEKHVAAARAAYRRLWKEEFGFAPKVDLEPTAVASNPLEIIQTPDLSHEGGLQSMLAICREGKETVDELVELVRDERSPAERLGAVSQEIERINADIEDLGHSYPSLSALVRYFVMEKENMRGDDPIVLASEMKMLYGQLQGRSEKFGALYNHSFQK